MAGMPALRELRVGSNQLRGEIPSGFSSRFFQELDLYYNALYIANPQEYEAFVARYGRYELESQVVPPSEFSAISISPSDLRVDVKGIPLMNWSGVEGGYYVYASLQSGGPYSLAATITRDACANLKCFAVLSGLKPGLDNYIVIKTFSLPNFFNKNSFESEYSREIVAATSSCLHTTPAQSLGFPPLADEGKFEVQALNTCPWFASTSVNWIRITSGFRGQGNGEVTFAVEANPGPSRSGKILIGDEEFLISQEGGGCEASLSPAVLEFKATGGTDVARVIAADACSWGVQSDSNWLLISGTNVGSGPGTIQIQVDSNPGEDYRIGHIRLGKQVLEVRQEGSQASLFVPVVLTTTGFSGRVYSSELAIANRGDLDASLQLEYVASSGGEGGRVPLLVPAHRQTVIPDVITFLNMAGLPVSTSSTIGTLTIKSRGLDSGRDVNALVRTTTSYPDNMLPGRSGLSYGGLQPWDGFQGPVIICGLRGKFYQEYTNLALQNMGGAQDGSITLRATYFNQDGQQWITGNDVTLPPGGFHQINAVSHVGQPYENAYIRIERTRGTAPFYAYAVVNDHITGDGAFITPLPEKTTASAGQIIPILLETDNQNGFQSELILTNWTDKPKQLRLVYSADHIATPDGSTEHLLSLAAGQQLILPNFIQTLREKNVPGIGPSGTLFAGPLMIFDQMGHGDGIYAGIRILSPLGSTSGKLGLYVPSVPLGGGFNAEAWLYGLRQDAENRSNLAIVNTGEVDNSASVFAVDLYDGDKGQLVRTIEDIRVPAHRWYQAGMILDQYAHGVAQAYARVRKVQGNNPFLSYAVVNDGSRPGQRTGDGTYIAARP
jgi:hypothetical protein